jgi:hypothetical protein
MLRPALAALLAVAVALPAAVAFSSVPGGPHDDITAAAARVAGFPEGGIDALVAAVRAPDADETSIDSDGDVDAAGGYDPSHHCDRVPPASDETAFNATVAYVRLQGDEARNASLAGDAEGAVGALGRALHALEDCFSHSNAVDLPEPALAVHAAAGEGPEPAGLRLTAFQPGADDAERPPGDDYAHGEFAKDAADKNAESRTVLADNRTKFEAARDLATDAAGLFLRGWLAERNPAELEPLGGLDAPPGGGLMPRWAPAPALFAVVVAVSLAAVALRRR